MKAVPVTDVIAESSPPDIRVDMSQGLVFIELFSSPSCPFCPQAERNFGDILSDPGVIGYICMVQYFDRNDGAGLTRSACNMQQDLYARALKTNMRYTPQMIINGEQDVPGQKLESVVNAIRAKREQKTHLPLDILMTEGSEAGTIDAILPQVAGADKEEKFALRIVSIRRQVDVSALAGARQKRDASLRNVAVDIREGGVWDGRKTVWRVPFNRVGEADAMIVMVQDRNTGAILAAGQFILPDIQESQ